MSNLLSSFTVLCLCLCLASGSARAQLDDPSEPRAQVEVQARVERAFEAQERVPVFIVLREDTLAMDERKASLASVLGSELELWHRYANIPVIAGSLSRAGLKLLRQQPAVSAVQLDGTGTGGLAEALPAVGVDKLQSVRGLSGKGITVAVLDSGASTRHPALQGAIVAQHCFTRFGCPPSNSSESDSAEDDHNHGSNVTGIVASRGAGSISKGYAPAASIVAVKVLNSQNAGQTSDWIAGFDWVLTNREKYKIRVINASLVSDEEYADAASCDRGEVAMAMVVKKLFDAGVTITGSSGNTGHTETMTSPSCNTGVIAVGATYDSNLGKQPENGSTYQALGGSRWPACSDAMTNTKTIACFTSTAGARLDLLAPGSQMTSTGRGTGSSLFRGTSQAAPGVAGLSALLLECNPALTPSMILDVLKKTGEPVVDPRTSMKYPLIRGVEAADMACGGAATGAAGAGGMGAMTPAAGGGGGGSLAANGGGAGSPVAGSTGAPVAGAVAVPAASTGVTTVTTPRTANAGTSAPSNAATAGAGVLQAGTTGGLTSPQSATPAAAAQDSGCQCSALGAVPGTPRISLWALAVLGVCVLDLRSRKRQRARTSSAVTSR